MKFSAYGEESTNPLKKGDILITFRGDEFTFHGVFHPRKLTVISKTGQLRDLYANVLGAGIFCDTTGLWTFTPEWPTHDKPGIPPQTYSYSIHDNGSWRTVATGLSHQDISDIEVKQAESGRSISNGDFRFNTEY